MRLDSQELRRTISYLHRMTAQAPSVVPLRIVRTLNDQIGYATRVRTAEIRAGAGATCRVLGFSFDGSQATRYFRKQVLHWYSPFTGHIVSECIA